MVLTHPPSLTGETHVDWYGSAQNAAAVCACSALNQPAHNKGIRLSLICVILPPLTLLGELEPLGPAEVPRIAAGLFYSFVEQIGSLATLAGLSPSPILFGPTLHAGRLRILDLNPIIGRAAAIFCLDSRQP